MNNLRKLRTHKRLSQQKLAEILHVSQQSIYKYENNITSPDIETLKSMADFFETSIDYLVDYTDIPNKIEPAIEVTLNADEELLIRKYKNLTLKQRSVIHNVIDSYSDKDLI